MISALALLLASKLPCMKAGMLGVIFSSPFAMFMETDWITKLGVVIGAGGLAAVIVAIARLRVSNANARKIDSESMIAQFLAVTERLQTENQALSNRLENMNQKESIITVSKHDALKENQAMIFYIQNLMEVIAVHNATCPHKLTIPQFIYTPLADILRAEDEARIKFADTISPVKTQMLS